MLFFTVSIGSGFATPDATNGLKYGRSPALEEHMSKGIIDLTDAVKPLVEDYAQEFGRQLPKYLAALEAWLQKGGHTTTAGFINDAKELLSKVPGWIIKSTAGIFTVPRTVFPSGILGDVMHKYANDIVDEIGRGLSEKSKPGRKADAAVPATPATPATPSVPPAPAVPAVEHTLFDLWSRLLSEDADQHDTNRSIFNRLKHRDAELYGKFVEAFHHRGTYEQFKTLVTCSMSENWGDDLDCLLGRTKTSEGIAAREIRQSEEMRNTITAAILSRVPRLDAKIAANAERIRLLDEKNSGKKPKRASKKDK